MYNKYEVENGKISFDELHELCHILAGEEGLSIGFKLDYGLKVYEGLVNLIAKTFTVNHPQLIDTYTLSFTYPDITHNLEEIFSVFKNENLIANMLYGTTELTLPDNYSNVIKFTLKGITELNSHNCKEKEGTYESVLYSRGLMVLSKDIYHIFKDLFTRFHLHPPSFYSIIHSLSDLERTSFFKFYSKTLDKILQLYKQRNMSN